MQNVTAIVRYHSIQSWPLVAAFSLACSGCSDLLGLFDSDRTVWVSATGLVLAPGDTLRLGVTMQDGRDIHRMPERVSYTWPSRLSISWASSDPAILSIDGAGLVTAHAPGRVAVRVEVDGAVDSATIGVRPVPGVHSTAFREISAGGSHTCAISATEDAYCWGSSWFGETGTGTHRRYVATASPALAGGGKTYSAISAGGVHSCALTSEGKAFCWGSGEYGQLGNGKLGPEYFKAGPQAVDGDLTFKEISAGDFHTCAISNDGDAYCWGGARWATPRRVDGGLEFASISVGGQTCGITTNGRGYCWWGTNEFGELGDGTTTPSNAPVAVSGDLRFQSLDAGSQHTCGVTVEGRAYCWGNNWHGRLGTGSELATAVAERVSTDVAFTMITAGGQHTCALTVEGAAYCWGRNWRGQVGKDFPFGDPRYTSDDYQELKPVRVMGGHSFMLLSAGTAEHTCGLTRTGDSFCWGSNEHGQLGYGKLEYFPGTDIRVRPAPVAVASPF